MGIGCQWNGCWLATNHLSGWPVQPIKELSSATGRYAGRGCALIRQLANAAVPFWRPSFNLPDSRAASRQKYHSLDQMLNGWNSHKHFAHPSRNFYRGGGQSVQNLASFFDPRRIWSVLKTEQRSRNVKLGTVRSLHALLRQNCPRKMSRENLSSHH